MSSMEFPFFISIVIELAFLMAIVRPDPPNLEMMIYGEEDARHFVELFTIYLPE